MISHDVFSQARRDTTVATATLRIEMIADLVCPWCYLGKRRLDTALASVHGPSHVSWNPFQLNPDMPARGMGLDEYLAGRFGDRASVQPAMDELTRVGKAEGVPFRFDRLERVPNTANAHLLIMHAESLGVPAVDIAESLFRGFFEDGRDIADRDVLASIGAAHGLGRADVHKALDSEAARQSVRAQEARVRRGGVTGVPNFLVNERLFVVGAHPASALVDVFDRAMFGAESNLPLDGSLH